MSTETTKDPVVNFELSEEHTHKGELCAPGDVISLRKKQADHLAELKRGKIVNT